MYTAIYILSTTSVQQKLVRLLVVSASAAVTTNHPQPLHVAHTCSMCVRRLLLMLLMLRCCCGLTIVLCPQVAAQTRHHGTEHVENTYYSLVCCSRIICAACGMLSFSLGAS